MTMKIRRRLFAALVGSMLAAGILTACMPTTTTIEGSRHELFDSLDSLTAASSLIAVVKVGDAVVADGRVRDTVYSTSVQNTFQPKGLATALAVEPSAPAEKVLVRQVGVQGDVAPYPFLKSGEVYLLFLTPTMLQGEASKQFYITGGSAGIYVEKDGTFSHGPFEEGDRLPETLSAEDLQ